jgi:hypothetical protein
MASGPTLLVVENYPPYTDIPLFGSLTSVLTVFDPQTRNPVTPDIVQITVHPGNVTPTSYTYGVGTAITNLTTNSWQFVLGQVQQAGLLLLTWMVSSSSLGLTGSAQSKLNVIEEGL